jgi:hypothetical protein
MWTEQGHRDPRHNRDRANITLNQYEFAIDRCERRTDATTRVDMRAKAPPVRECPCCIWNGSRLGDDRKDLFAVT